MEVGSDDMYWSGVWVGASMAIVLPVLIAVIGTTLFYYGRLIMAIRKSAYDEPKQEFGRELGLRLPLDVFAAAVAGALAYTVRDTGLDQGEIALWGVVALGYLIRCGFNVAGMRQKLRS